MTGTTIATTIDHSITLGVNGYTNPLFVAADGEIGGPRGSAAALYVPLLGAPAEVDNAGSIMGAAGRVGITGHNGAAGVYFADSGTITNTGEIAGGQGGHGAPTNGAFKSGNGGIGVQIVASGAVIDNKGSIYGGAGGAVGYPTAPSQSIGAGGYGVELGAGSTLRNSGNITGGAGGLTDQKDENRYAGSYGGEGVRDRQGVLFNSGTILGGDGGDGATAVYISGAGAIGRNTGQIIGGSSTTNFGYGGLGAYSGFGLIATDEAVFHNSGCITGGIGQVGAVLSNATLINDGVVQAGYDLGIPDFRNGAAGAVFYSGKLVNNGTILGGTSDYASNSVESGIRGGAGIIAYQGLTNHGQIIGGGGGKGDFGGSGGYGVFETGSGDGVDVIVNSGTITGGNGGDTSNALFDLPIGGSGGLGIALRGASLSNTGTVIGGNGGTSESSFGWGGGGGIGVGDVFGDIINHGVIAGGSGGNGGYFAGGGGGGMGVYLINANLSNAGAITGGNGGNGGNGGYRYHGGVGGDGVSANGGVIVNRGAITGGSGGGGSTGGYGGSGVLLRDVATLINSGTISGGAGGVGSTSTGAAGDAVYLYMDSILIIDPGAVFNGQVVADPTGGNTLELSGKSSSALTGIGTEFTGFATLAFAADAAWTLSGTSFGFATGEEITGFTNADAITLTDAAAASGSVTVANAGTVTIEAGDATYRLLIAGAAAGETDFRFAGDTLTKIGGPEMGFLALERAPAPAKAGGADFSAIFAGQTRAMDFFHGPAASSVVASETVVPGVAQLFLGMGQHPVLPGFTLHA